jgi:hypothetical protein
VILPVGGFGDLGSRRTLLSAEEVEDDRFLGIGARFRFWPGSLFAGGFRCSLFRGGGFR